MMALLFVQAELGGQLGLVDHDDIWSLIAIEPAQETLFLLTIDASHLPYQDYKRYLCNVEVPSIQLPGLIAKILDLRSMGVLHCPLLS